VREFLSRAPHTLINNMNLQILEEQLFETKLTQDELLNAMLAGALFAEVEEKRAQTIEDLIPAIVEFVRESMRVDEADMDDEVANILSLLESSRFKALLDEFHLFSHDSVVEAVFNLDNAFHRSVIMEYDLGSHRALVRFVDFQVEQRCPFGHLRALVDAAAVTADELCELCHRKMKLTRHHLVPREVHAKMLKKGFAKDWMLRLAAICRPCHSAVHR
jgi:hypothetical protein